MTLIDPALSKAASDEKLVVNGRYRIPNPDGTPGNYQRVSNFVRVLRDTYLLDRRNRRMVALGITRRPDLAARIAACTVEDRNELDSLCDEAEEAAEASSGRNFGTAMHAFTEQADRGETVYAPKPLNRDLDAYRATLTRYGIDMSSALMEQIVVLEELKVAGRFDRIVSTPAFEQPLIADLKTGSFLQMQEIAVQLACYANADCIYDPVADVRLPMPDVDKERALVIHLPIGQARCELIVVDIAAGWEAASHADWVRGWRKRPVVMQTFKPVTADTATPAAVNGSHQGSGVETLLPASPGPRLADGLIGSGLRRKVEQMTDQQREKLAKELAERGLPRLSEATLDHQVGWLQAVKAVAGDGLGPAERTLESGTVLHRKPTREWLTACVENLRTVDGGLEALRVELDGRLLPKLSECPDEWLDDWAQACSVAERKVGAPFPPLKDEFSPTRGETAGDSRAVPRPLLSPADQLRSRYDCLPADLRIQVDARREGTILDGVNLLGGGEAAQLELAAQFLDEAEAAAAARVERIGTLLEGCDAELANALSDTVGTAFTDFTSTHVERLEALLAAIDAGHIGLTYEPGQVVLTTNDTALVAVAEAHGGKGNALKVAQAHARTHGRQSPRSFAAVADDPLLVALCLRGDGAT